MAKKQVRTRIKRSERKNIAVGQAHIKSTFNNTIITLTDPHGNVITWQSDNYAHRPARERHHLAKRRHRWLQGLQKVHAIRRADGC